MFYTALDIKKETLRALICNSAANLRQIKSVVKVLKNCVNVVIIQH